MKVSLTGFKIPVDNLDDAIEFYTEKLFFSLLFREDSFGWATVQLENQNVGLYIPGKGGGDRTVGGTVDFSFLIDDFQKYFEKVKVGKLYKSKIDPTTVKKITSIIYLIQEQ